MHSGVPFIPKVEWKVFYLTGVGLECKIAKDSPIFKVLSKIDDLEGTILIIIKCLNIRKVGLENKFIV